MSRTDFCAATVAKSYEHKLERESCSQRGRLKSAGTKLASCHPIIFSTRKKTEEKRCFESERCFKTIFSSQNMRFLNGICGLIGNPLVRVIRLFLWDFVPSCSGGFFCFLTLVLSKKAGNFSTVSFFQQAQRIRPWRGISTYAWLSQTFRLLRCGREVGRGREGPAEAGQRCCEPAFVSLLGL